MATTEKKDSKKNSSPDMYVPEVNDEIRRKARVGLIVWRCLSTMMMIFFLLAAGVQFNDPDPYLWVPLYGTASLLTVCVIVRPNISDEKPWTYVYCIHTAFCAAMFVYVLAELFIAFWNPEVDGTLNPLTYEEGRELAGIMITSVWLLICKQPPILKEREESTASYGLMTFTVILGTFPLFLWGLCYARIFSSSFSFCKDMMMHSCG